VIETSDIQMSVYTSIGDRDLPTYHQGINAQIRAALNNEQDIFEERQACAKESLRCRLSSKVKQIDAQKAYSGKIYSKQALRDAMGICGNGKIGFLAAHVFCDSPHLSSSMLHDDYYCWLIESINSCANADGIDWFVKPHPASALYGEQGMVEEVVREKGARNIHVCPYDLSTSSLCECADIILTVHGTIGIEYSCFGIPTILAGTPFYAGFGFTYEPKSIDEYNSMITNAASLDRLSASQVNMALQVYAIWERQFDWNNPIITSDVLAHVWGSGVPRDLEKAYDAIVENLRNNNPRDLKLWHFVRSFSAKNNICNV